MAGYEKALGAEHSDTLMSVNNLGLLLYKKGDLPGAVALLRGVAGKSPQCLAGVRYDLACYEALAGNVEESKRRGSHQFRSSPPPCRLGGAGPAVDMEYRLFPEYVSPSP